MKAPEFSGGKVIGSLMFELECVGIAPVLSLFGGIVNVSIGFNIQESLSSSLGTCKIVPRTPIEYWRGLFK